MAAGDKLNEANMVKMINSRMGWDAKDPECPLRRYLPVLMRDSDQVIVFLVHESQYLVLEDDAAMFPSDQFVTQLRLFVGGDHPQAR